MNSLLEQHFCCPYCGEAISMLIDCTEADQEYIEDCEVCCRPIVINVRIDSSGEPEVLATSENEA